MITRSLLPAAALALAATLAACDAKEPAPGTVKPGAPGVTGNPETPATPVATNSSSIAGAWVSDFDAMHQAWVDQKLKDTPGRDKSEALDEAKSVVERLVGPGDSIIFNDDHTLVYQPSGKKGSWSRTGDVISYASEFDDRRIYRMKLDSGKLVEQPFEGSTPGIVRILRRK